MYVMVKWEKLLDPDRESIFPREWLNKVVRSADSGQICSFAQHQFNAGGDESLLLRNGCDQSDTGFRG